MTAVRLETPRLVLRPFARTDAPHVVRLHGDRRVMRYIGRPATPASVLERDIPHLLARYDLAQGPGYWAAEVRATGEVVGWFELRPLAAEPDGFELGYRLLPEAWGHGYATEGAAALVRRAFEELGATRVVATTMAVNVASRRVMERVGLRFVRAVHQDWPDPLEGAEEGDVEYALTRAVWASRA
jgi:RimJ/RimL family protein N-acetyltransferase